MNECAQRGAKNQQSRAPARISYRLQHCFSYYAARVIASGATGPLEASCRASRQLGQNGLRKKGDFVCSGRLVEPLLVDQSTMRTGRSDSPRALVSNLIRLSTMPRRWRHVAQRCM